MTIEWMEKYMLEAERMITDNQVEKGLAMLNDLLYEEPGYASLHNHLGWAYMYYAADNARAAMHLSLALKFEAGFGPSYLHLAALRNRMHQYDEAIAIARTGLTFAAVNKVALYEQIGIAYELKREYAKAVRMYKEALASTVGFDGETMLAGIKRCRKKRLAMMFTF